MCIPQNRFFKFFGYKSRWLFALFSYSALCGSVNEPIRWEWQTGYRNDIFHWHLKQFSAPEKTVYSERFRDLQFWVNSLTVRAIHRDIAIFARCSYGALGKGELKQKYSSLSFAQDPIIFHSKPSSWNFDSWGFLGYAVDLTAGRNYHVILVPLIGYGLNAELMHGNGPHDSKSESVLFSSELLSEERTSWFGPLFGSQVIIQPGGSLQFEAGYAYHRLHLRFRSKNRIEATSEERQVEKIHVKDRANLAHSGWARIDYTFFDVWRIGLEGGINYFSSRILDAAVKNETTLMRSPQKFKARWAAVSGTFILSRFF